MSEYLLIFVGAALVNNFVLVEFLGLCPFMGTSNKVATSIGLGTATAFVLTLSSASTYLIHEYILLPLDLEFLRTIAFILVIAAMVQFTEMYLKKTSPLLYEVLGIYLPLITTNCAVLGVALINVRRYDSFLESFVFGFGAAIGFAVVLILFSAIRERINVADVPESFKGAPIGLITAGLMSLAFMGFTGLI